MIPTNQTVQIIRSESLDDWGIPIPSDTDTYKANVRSKKERISDQNGNEIVVSTTVLLKGYVKIGYDDVIEWTNRDGEHFTLVPKLIQTRRDFANVAQFTKVQA